MSRRRDRSLRAQARAILMENKPMLDALSAAPAAASPQPSLTERARALYEDSVVPVRDIARLAGVSERTIYKYAHRQNWKPRYRWDAKNLARWRPGWSGGDAPDQGSGKAGARHRGWQPEPAFAPAKGAGARFIRREDSGKPFPVGLKANDRSGAARAAETCAAAQAASAQAEHAAAFERRLAAYEDALALLPQVFALDPPGAAGARPRNTIQERAHAGCLRVAVLNWERALEALSAKSAGDGRA